MGLGYFRNFQGHFPVTLTNGYRLFLQQANRDSDVDKMSNGSRIIPIQMENSTQPKSQQNGRPNPSQRWGNSRENNETVQSNNKWVQNVIRHRPNSIGKLIFGSARGRMVAIWQVFRACDNARFWREFHVFRKMRIKNDNHPRVIQIRVRL